MKAAICFAQFGPYHHARVSAFQQTASFQVIPLQLADRTQTYEWSSHTKTCKDLQTLCVGAYETLKPLNVFLSARRFFKREQITCALLPSYAPAAETALLIAAKFSGVRCVMMNESHAGTEKATGWKKALKRRLVSLFDTALVGGTPQKRHFINLGIPEDRIFLGYDAIDNDYFANAAAQARENADAMRETLELPPRYFLSLGRLVEKKNLSSLVKAYSEFVQDQQKKTEMPALVFVGSGPEEPTLRKLCKQGNLEVIDHTSDSAPRNLPPPTTKQPTTNNQQPTTQPMVHFYGFRQIEENPAFYALADIFILPSLWEEWGLVVNEAMACGLPVIVSKEVGSAEDLVSNGENGFTFDPLDPEELSGCLSKVHRDDTLRSQMGKKSAKIIAKWGCDNFAHNAVAAAKAAVQN